ncbi:MarR family winged helix-turn-helix transcriptional regulator [Melghirimyces algeriensis]|uniref:DNA-binding transcriptional regulator, MarR family n=1 Tax=Melghirimyces algeriensis TaxID=910412 RepID=A0A521FHM6_9BACL|nr:MarR family transcriptional regulator [Melghirimyces algeriensis]SMO95655.1 DNA-binding transcriptional regulator, MarR family [Melghirimyces algeriensis]
MDQDASRQLIDSWLSFTHIHMKIANELESALQQNHQICLKEFYVLLFLSEAPDKKLRLQQLQDMVGLSQSAMSRLVSRFEARNCGVLQRHLCEEDRRSIYTSLTKEGEEKLEKSLITIKATLAKAFAKENIQDELQDLIQQIKR